MNAPDSAATPAAAQYPLHAFRAYGIELEYMLVYRDSLDVAPLGDKVLRRIARRSAASRLSRENGCGRLAWANELVLHVLEVRNLQPTSGLADLRLAIGREVSDMNRLLEPLNAMLMPGAMHPWMDPRTETRLWQGTDARIYRAYERLFGCRSHGWANLQSMQLNLPFGDDAEFARVHAAVRLIVPILPAIAAGSPYAEGRFAGALDYRMQAYRTNSERFPLIVGPLVPETISSRAEYDARVLQPMYRAIAPQDPDGTLQHEWLNSRAAIARFDRGAIEIRVSDAQECPTADLAVAAAAIDLANTLYDERFAGLQAQQRIGTAALKSVLLDCVRDGERARIAVPEYLRCFGLEANECEAGALWRRLAERMQAAGTRYCSLWGTTLAFILERGTLARRLVEAAGESRARLAAVGRTLCRCLETDSPFEP